MADYTFTWHGRARKAELLAAVKGGIDETMAVAVGIAKAKVPVRTAILQGSIQMRPATIRGGIVTGLWGSFQVNYALYVHEGTRPHIIRPRTKKALFWKGAAHPVKLVHHPGTKPNRFLSEAADIAYPGLPGRVSKRLP